MGGTDLDASISPVSLRSLETRPANYTLENAIIRNTTGKLALCCLGSRTPLFASNNERMYMAWPLQRERCTDQSSASFRERRYNDLLKNRLLMLALGMLALYVTYDTVCLVDMIRKLVSWIVAMGARGFAVVGLRPRCRIALAVYPMQFQSQPSSSEKGRSVMFLMLRFSCGDFNDVDQRFRIAISRFGLPLVNSGIALFVKAGDFITHLFLLFSCPHNFPFSSSGCFSSHPP